jgi:hypothetical protein
MVRIALLALAVSTSLVHPSVAKPVQNNDTIPPNCLIDPFTGKMECLIWPTCTLDPWTGKMNCPVPPRNRGSTFSIQ